MPHGTPDWGHEGPKETTFGLDDLGEHAVRMGSPHLWDRRGDVMAMADFRDGLGQAQIQSVGVGGTVGLSTGHTRTGAYSVVFGGDGVNVTDQYAFVELALPAPSKVGIEFSFSFESLDGVWEAYLYWTDAAREYQARVRFRPAGLLRDVSWFDGGYHPFNTGLFLNQRDRPIHTMKMVVDLLNHEYVRFIINNHSYSLIGNYAMDVAPSIQSYLWAWGIYHRQVGDVSDVYLDRLIVTQNEP
ncbi:unnamed protein product [marine sediment metagenome]|uniref:Uncharacterized protein n=1 Tax=marine sediment metagenome TaxID=412755 RepID=X1RWW6_9ZZZZ